MTETTKKSLPFWLVASVLVNMILIGLVAGLFLRPGPGPARGPDRPWTVSEVDNDDRRAVRAVLARGLVASRAEIKSRQETEQAMVAQLRAEPFDPVAARAALDAFRAADCAAREATAIAIFNELETLTPDQRAYAVRILASGSDRRGRRFRPDREDRLPPGP